MAGRQSPSKRQADDQYQFILILPLPVRELGYTSRHISQHRSLNFHYEEDCYRVAEGKMARDQIGSFGTIYPTWLDGQYGRVPLRSRHGSDIGISYYEGASLYPRWSN